MLGNSYGQPRRERRSDGSRILLWFDPFGLVSSEGTGSPYGYNLFTYVEPQSDLDGDGKNERRMFQIEQKGGGSGSDHTMRLEFSKRIEIGGMTVSRTRFMRHILFDPPHWNAWWNSPLQATTEIYRIDQGPHLRRHRFGIAGANRIERVFQQSGGSGGHGWPGDSMKAAPGVSARSEARQLSPPRTHASVNLRGTCKKRFGALSSCNQVARTGQSQELANCKNRLWPRTRLQTCMSATAMASANARSTRPRWRALTAPARCSSGRVARRNAGAACKRCKRF